MKKRTLLYVGTSILVLFSILVTSCRKEINSLMENDEDLDNIIELSKAWLGQKATLDQATYRKQYEAGVKNTLPVSATGVKKIPAFYKLRPLWAEAFKVVTGNGQERLAVPTIDNKLTNADYTIKRFFIFEFQNGQLYNGNIIEFLGMKYDVKAHLEQLISSYQHASIQGFNGAIFIYDLNYFPLSNYVFEGGKRTSYVGKLRLLPLARTSSGGVSTEGYETGIYDGNGCANLYYCYDSSSSDGPGVHCDNVGTVGSCNTGSPTGSDSGYNSGGSTSGGTGGGGPYGGNEQPNAEFYRDTDISGLKPCMQTVFNDIKRLNGTIPAMIGAFTPDGPDYKWTLKDGVLADNKNGETNIDANKMATTIIDGSKFTEATNLAIARTIMHEAIHAYLVSYFKNDPLNAQKEYAGLVDAWAEKKGWEALNEVHHTYFVNQFITPMISALTEYGNIVGMGFPSNMEKMDFYDRLAWGGLTETKAFAALSTERKEKIKQTLTAEQFGKDLNGNTASQKGSKGGCK